MAGAFGASQARGPGGHALGLGGVARHQDRLAQRARLLQSVVTLIGFIKSEHEVQKCVVKAVQNERINVWRYAWEPGKRTPRLSARGSRPADVRAMSARMTHGVPAHLRSADPPTPGAA